MKEQLTEEEKKNASILKSVGFSNEYVRELLAPMDDMDFGQAGAHPATLLRAFRKLCSIQHDCYPYSVGEAADLLIVRYKQANAVFKCRVEQKYGKRRQRA